MNVEFSLRIPKRENGSWTRHFQYINRLVKLPENKRFFAVEKHEKMWIKLKPNAKLFL